MWAVDVWLTSLTHNVYEKVAQLASFFQLCRQKKGLAHCTELLWKGNAVEEFVENLAMVNFTSNPVLTVPTMRWKV